jgi:hypothetical protein
VKETADALEISTDAVKDLFRRTLGYGWAE